MSDYFFYEQFISSKYLSSIWISLHLNIIFKHAMGEGGLKDFYKVDNANTGRIFFVQTCKMSEILFWLISVRSVHNHFLSTILWFMFFYGSFPFQISSKRKPDFNKNGRSYSANRLDEGFHRKNTSRLLQRAKT